MSEVFWCDPQPSETSRRLRDALQRARDRLARDLRVIEEPLAAYRDVLLEALDDLLDGVFLAPVVEDEGRAVVTFVLVHFWLCG